MIGAPDPVNNVPIDAFTVGHFYVGAISRRIRVKFSLSLMAAVLWEIVERPMKEAWPGAFPHPSQDSPQNAVVDVAAWVLGWYLADRAG